MKIQSSRGLRRFQLQILAYGNCYYIDRITQMERALAKKPRLLQIDMVGMGEIPADFALMIRSALMNRSSKTRIITNARSSLQGGSVLVWLLGDSRIIRDDARLYFRRANLPEHDEIEPNEPKDRELNSWEVSSEIDPEEGDYAKVLQLINEFLPVRELTGRLIGVSELQQFGLIENEKVDLFLATALGSKREPDLAGRKKTRREEDHKNNNHGEVEGILDFTI